MLKFGGDQNKLHHPYLHLNFVFFVIIFFYAFGDAVMSFMAPNLIENVVDNTFVMGLVFSFSSLVGLIMDYILSNGFKEKSIFFYSLTGIGIAALFPLAFLIKNSVFTALFAMAIWGIYYELVLFAKSNFVHYFLNHDQHDLGWAFFNAFGSLAYLIGPTFALFIYGYGEKFPLYVAFIIQLVAIVGLFIFHFVFQQQIVHTQNFVPPQTSLKTGIKLWQILNSRLRPVLIYLFIINLVDATFWTMGAIIASTHRSPLANLFFIFYLLPAFIIAPLGIRVSRFIGKKRTAYLGGLFAGIIFGISLLFSSFTIFMACIATGSIFFAMTIPEIRGAIEDYCERLGHNANSLVGLTSSMGSLGYVVGPILAGGIAEKIGDQQSFGVIGWLLASTSLFLLFSTPRKIRLPQQQLHAVNT